MCLTRDACPSLRFRRIAPPRVAGSHRRRRSGGIASRSWRHLFLLGWLVVGVIYVKHLQLQLQLQLSLREMLHYPARAHVRVMDMGASSWKSARVHQWYDFFRCNAILGMARPWRRY
jgi:hypothetical protein